MGTLPYLPAGSTDTPAQRFLLFSDGNHKVQRLDESVVTKDGTSFTASWESKSLNKSGQFATLTELQLFYAALAATTVTVGASDDGGETWTDVVVNLALTAERIEVATAGFNLTGSDLRFRVQLDTDVLANIYGFRPVLVDRGDLVF